MESLGMQLCYYRNSTIASLADAGLRTADGRERVVRVPGLARVRVPVRPIAFGQVDPPTRPFTEWPAGGWEETGYECDGTEAYLVRDCVVHGEQGIVTVDDHMISESRHFASVGDTDFSPVDEHVLSTPAFEPAAEIRRAAHLMCGFVGNRNYAHWWVDVLTSYAGAPFGGLHEDRVLLLPGLRAGWQRNSLGLLPELAARAVFVGARARFSCGELLYLPSLARSDLHPHPVKRLLLDEVRARAGGAPVPGRRLYIDRSDARARRMRNEPDAIALLARHGFESVTLTGRSVDEQVRLFSEATHVIGAHGAGLANILFCRPGARLLELHMDASLVWSIRRLASLAGVSYGCLLGDVVREDDAVDLREWTVPLDALEAALPGFLAEA